MSKPLFESRFWSNVSFPRGGSNGCWLWCGGKDPHGYGRISAGGRMALAHRISWALARGETNDLYVLHSCDNTSCVNPAHLRLGTARDNADDMISRGRVARGFSIPNTKMSQPDMERALVFVASGESLCSVGKRYGVSHGTIRAAVTGRTFRHIKRPLGMEIKQ